MYIYIYTHIYTYIQVNSQTPTCTVTPLASLLTRLAGEVLGRFGAKKWYSNFTHSEVMPLLSFEVWFSTQEKASCDCVS